MTPYDFVLETVKKAGVLLLEEQKKGFTVATKGSNPRDIVTSIDVAVNTFIVEEIKKNFPDHSIYSEEGGGVETTSTFQWVIDPIDGTANFSRSIPHFAVCIGLLENNVPIVGAVFNPVTQELFSFKKGGGAFLNGVPIHVSSITELSKSHVLMRAGRNPDNWDWGGEAYKRLLAHASKTNNFAGSALDICFLAAGRVEAVVYGNLNTMEIATAFGMLYEAGGVASDAHGNPVPYSTQSRKLFAANSQHILNEVRALLG
jgi:myo-inositol-1(or 4)-monophosphatase